jgi:hypothetical protein
MGHPVGFGVVVVPLMRDEAAHEWATRCEMGHPECEWGAGVGRVVGDRGVE